MRYLSFISVACGTAILTTGLHFPQTNALAAQEYDRTIERAAMQRLKEKISGELRGTISIEDDAAFVFVSPNTTKTATRSLVPNNENPYPGDGPGELKPMVNMELNDFIDEDGIFIDRTMTGSIQKSTADQTRIPKTIWDRFDSDGRYIKPTE